MAAFDFQSGVSGAGTGGSVGGPWGALAGFVIGGFMGGHKKKQAQKKEQKRQKQLKKLASPEHLAKVTQQLTPQFRQQIAGGAGANIVGGIQNSIARRGLSGTGIGTAISGGASGIPDILAFQQALGQAENVIDRQISAKKGQPAYGGEDVAGDIDQAGDIYDQYRRLSAGAGGPEGGLQQLGSGEFDRLEANQSASESFADASSGLDFSKFQYGPRR